MTAMAPAGRKSARRTPTPSIVRQAKFNPSGRTFLFTKTNHKAIRHSAGPHPKSRPAEAEILSRGWPTATSIPTVNVTMPAASICCPSATRRPSPMPLAEGPESPETKPSMTAVRQK